MINKRVIAYFDGSNFYHLLRLNFPKNKIDFFKLTKNLLEEKEDLVKINYFTAPVNKQEAPEIYSNQQKFFEKLKQNSLIETHMGKLVKRPLNRININCPKCGIQKAEFLECPSCNKKIRLDKTFKSTEKGVDVQMSIKLLLDAIENKYDTALIFSGDADFCPAIEYVIKNLNKKVILCHFSKPITSELIQKSSSSRLISKEIVTKSKI